MTLHVYQRGHFPRETLATLWGYVEHDKAAPKLFYAQPLQDTPVSTVGDLAAFVGYFEDPKRHLLLVEGDDGQVMGMVWFDDVLPGHRAAVNAFYRRRYWGAKTRVATREALRLAFGSLQVQSIWAYTPWPEAVSHALACGMKPHAMLRDFALVHGQLRDLTILRIDKGDLIDG